MQNGKIKSFFPHEKYGFIIGEDGEEYFFHITHIHPKSRNRKIAEGVPVQFDVKVSVKGDIAVNIRIIEQE